MDNSLVVVVVVVVNTRPKIRQSGRSSLELEFVPRWRWKSGVVIQERRFAVLRLDRRGHSSIIARLWFRPSRGESKGHMPNIRSTRHAPVRFEKPSQSSFDSVSFSSFFCSLHHPNAKRNHHSTALCYSMFDEWFRFFFHQLFFVIIFLLVMVTSFIFSPSRNGLCCSQVTEKSAMQLRRKD